MTVSLLVVYTERLEQCRDFYAGLGLTLVPEQHGNGPVHWSTTFPDGLVLELYPGRGERVTGRLRLGLRLPSGHGVAPGKLSDPDGRTVVVEQG